MRIPRKLKKQIPEGMYCYKGLSFDRNTGVYHIKPCVLFDYRKYKDMKPTPIWMGPEDVSELAEEKEGWCKLIKCEIEDQCKSCGERYNW